MCPPSPLSPLPSLPCHPSPLSPLSYSLTPLLVFPLSCLSHPSSGLLFASCPPPSSPLEPARPRSPGAPSRLASPAPSVLYPLLVRPFSPSPLVFSPTPSDLSPPPLRCLHLPVPRHVQHILLYSSCLRRRPRNYSTLSLSCLPIPLWGFGRLFHFAFLGFLPPSLPHSSPSLLLPLFPPAHRTSPSSGQTETDRERQGQTETGRDRQTDKQGETETGRDRQRQTQTNNHRQPQTATDRERKTETARGRRRQTELERRRRAETAEAKERAGRGDHADRNQPADRPLGRPAGQLEENN